MAHGMGDTPDTGDRDHACVCVDPSSPRCAASGSARACVHAAASQPSPGCTAHRGPAASSAPSSAASSAHWPMAVHVVFAGRAAFAAASRLTLHGGARKLSRI